ncbi:hypothetical protein DQ04_10831030 [Trypanosoma grayi]|uniref:hypothetical protein n=1 Tax=Trypanosoma grayi TaxID=71804 RepID=UPI0004F41CCE|nr:hypothetical protein DQ04_10831030 [Trypanosoma grayi]KEG07120.1 hypothetical protein DQ04_10831030 [Trypanosoma grayi]
MSQPLWLMMGTAFLLRTTHTTASGRRYLLSAKHTFAPWQYVKDPERLKIPEDCRKTRFIIGRLYLPDKEGHALASSSMELQLVALHPTLDVALLALKAPSPASAGASVHAVLGEVERRADAAGSGLALSPIDPATSTTCVVAGYRGAGSLGLLDTFDPDLLQKLPAAQRDELLSKLRCVEGEQVAAVAQVEVLHASGMCRAVQGRCYHGMSGAPVLVDEGTCGGVLYGKHAECAEHLGYTPASCFEEWVRSAVGAG